MEINKPTTPHTHTHPNKIYNHPFNEKVELIYFYIIPDIWVNLKIGTFVLSETKEGKESFCLKLTSLEMLQYANLWQAVSYF